MGALTREYSPSDILCAIFYYASDDEGKTEITTDEVKIHQALYEIKKQSKLGLLDFFEFRRYRTHHSEELEASLSILRISQILTPYGESTGRLEETYKLTKVGKEHVENEILQKFTDKEKEDLKNIARELEEIVKSLEI